MYCPLVDRGVRGLGRVDAARAAEEPLDGDLDLPTLQDCAPEDRLAGGHDVARTQDLEDGLEVVAELQRDDADRGLNDSVPERLRPIAPSTRTQSRTLRASSKRLARVHCRMSLSMGMDPMEISTSSASSGWSCSIVSTASRILWMSCSCLSLVVGIMSVNSSLIFFLYS